MALWQWSTTPATNASAGLIDWAEGQPPSTVNDSARQMMADVATWFQSPEWLNYGLTPTFVSTAAFTVAGNQTGIYTVGRRVRAFVSAGTIYGTIATSAFTSLTTVTVAWDSGALDSGVSEVDVSILNPAAPSISQFNTLTLNDTSGGNTTLNINATGGSGANIRLNGNGTAPVKWIRSNSGHLQFLNSAYSAILLDLDDSGNMSAMGNIVSSSDRRLKTDIEVIENALKKVRALNGVTYRRKDIEQGIRHTGLLAQDVRKVAPEAVREGPDGYLSVAYGNLVGLLVEAIKELATELEALKVAK